MKSEFYGNQRKISKCHSCFLEIPQCVCFSRSTVNFNQKCVSYDAFLVFTSLLMTYWLFVKKFNNLYLPMPILCSYLMIKLKLFSPNNSVLVSFTLKVCRFFVCHYKLIIVMLLVSCLSSFFNVKFVFLLFVFILFYLFAKYTNKSDLTKTNELTEVNIDKSNDHFVDMKMK